MTHQHTLSFTHLCCIAALVGCGSLPQSGPATKDFGSIQSTDHRIQVIALNPDITHRLNQKRLDDGFAKTFGATQTGKSIKGEPLLGIADILEVTIWEAPPATLFAAVEQSARGGPLSGARGVTLPEQVISTDGIIRVPFAGEIQALGRIPSQIAADIVERLRGKAHQPQVLVRLVRSSSSLVTVVGEVATSSRVPLSARGERLLDAVAAAGGSKQPIHKTTLQLTRGNTTAAMPLERIIREPEHNIPLQTGDIITALFQPASFTALGASTQNTEVSFEAQGISLSQALARVGGLQDSRADAQGVFIFRFESPEVLARLADLGAAKATSRDQNGRIPVIYQIDLKKPESLFLAQTFAIENKDLLYISNAPAADWQKFANLIYTIALPAISTTNTLR